MGGVCLKKREEIMKKNEKWTQAGRAIVRSAVRERGDFRQNLSDRELVESYTEKKIRKPRSYFRQIGMDNDPAVIARRRKKAKGIVNRMATGEERDVMKSMKKGSRMAEIEVYAKENGITIAKAMIQLMK